MNISNSYDGISREYFRARKGTPKLAEFVVSHAGLGSNSVDKSVTIVELGVGGGQQTEFIEKELDAAGISKYSIFAYDKSADQLGLLKNRIKKGEISDRVIPTQFDFDGTLLPLESESADLAYMAWVLHHLTHQQAVLDDVARITRRGSKFFMYQVTIEDLENHQLDEFFPMKYDYDKQRYPTRPGLKKMFLDAGFTYEEPHVIKRDNMRLIDRALLESVENTSIDSVLRMIRDNDPAAFTEGVNRLKREVERSERAAKYRNYRTVDRKIFWGIKG